MTENPVNEMRSLRVRLGKCEAERLRWIAKYNEQVDYIATLEKRVRELLQTIEGNNGQHETATRHLQQQLLLEQRERAELKSNFDRETARLNRIIVAQAAKAVGL